MSMWVYEGLHEVILRTRVMLKLAMRTGHLGSGGCVPSF